MNQAQTAVRIPVFVHAPTPRKYLPAIGTCYWDLLWGPAYWGQLLGKTAPGAQVDRSEEFAALGRNHVRTILGRAGQHVPNGLRVARIADVELAKFHITERPLFVHNESTRDGAEMIKSPKALAGIER